MKLASSIAKLLIHGLDVIYRKLIEVDSIECEVLIIDRVECSAQYSGLHLVLLFR